MTNIQQKMDAEQAKRNRRNWALSPEQRMERFMELQAAAEQLLTSNPEALAAFHRRNRQKRTASRVRELLVQLSSRHDLKTP